MKIVLSPSKTKTIQGVPTVPPFNLAVTERILEQVRSLSVGELGKALKLKDDKAAELHQFYASLSVADMAAIGAASDSCSGNDTACDSYDSIGTACNSYDGIGTACDSYDGIVFKKLDWTSLADEAQRFGDEHLVILSALYGVLEPHMGIGAYRLDLVDKIGVNLYDVWGDAVKGYFHKEDWILNLASKEYAKLVEHPAVVTVEFWERKGNAYKQMSTSSKISRGLLARYVLEHKLTELRDLPNDINGFTRVTDVAAILVPTESLVVRYEKEG